MPLAEKLTAARAYLTERAIAPVPHGTATRVLNAWRQSRQPSRRRGFTAASINRLTSSWVSQSIAIDQELRTELDRLIVRSRDGFKNNPYLRRFGLGVQKNVVGPNGFTLQARVIDQTGAQDQGANTAIERAFARWSRMGVCEVSGRYSRSGFERAAAMSLARDGAFLIRIVESFDANEFGFAVQLLDVMRIDTLMNRERAGITNAIYMGVEINAQQRPVAYWLRDPRTNSGTRERVPASEIIHGYIPLEEEQTRGVPWAHAALMELHQLKGYREAAVIAARGGASKAGFYTVSDDANPDQLPADQDEGQLVQSVEAGTFEVLPYGYRFESYDPTYPHEQFDAFNKAMLRGIASALDDSYNSLANDLEGVSFSSIRSGELEKRDTWKMIQDYMIEALCERLYDRWLQNALLRGAIVLDNGSPLPLAKIDKFRARQWQPRHWPWVDPVKDIETAEREESLGLTTISDLCAMRGLDLEDVLKTKQSEALLMAKYNVTLGPRDMQKHAADSQPGNAAP